MPKLFLRHLHYSHADNFRENERKSEAPGFFNGGAFSESGYIERQSALCDLPIGARTSDYCGCGWIAAYNLFRSLGTVLNIPVLIEQFEHGLLFSGALGTRPLFFRRFLKKSGLSVVLFLRKMAFLKRRAKNAVLFYLRPDLSAHYVAFSEAGETEGEPLFFFHNTDFGAASETLSAFLEKTPHLLTIFYAVK